jgi:uncharacterized cupredoxin-like copper-binding protein
MNVNKFKINRRTLSNNKYFNLPLNMKYQLVDKYNIINEKFIKVETDKSINPIQDFDSYKFIPYNENQEIDYITYNVSFLIDFNGNTFLPSIPTNYDYIGINSSDILLNKKSYNKSFLRLLFYDSYDPLTQNLIYVSTLFPKVNVNINNTNSLQVKFSVFNNKFKTEKSEGFYLYHPKVDLTNLYMRAEFNNAKTGITTRLMSNNNQNLTIDELLSQNGNNSNIYTKYILKKINNKYYYEIDLDYSNNINLIQNSYNIFLYETTAL